MRSTKGSGEQERTDMQEYDKKKRRATPRKQVTPTKRLGKKRKPSKPAPKAAPAKPAPKAAPAKKRKLSKPAPKAAPKAAPAKKRKPSKAAPSVDALVRAQQKARGKTPGSRARRQLRTETNQLEKERLERALEAQRLPQRTPAERRYARETLRGKMLADFKRLLEHAKKTNQLPEREVSGKYDSYGNIGERRYVRVGRVLDDSSVEEILYKCREASKRLSGRFGIWWARVDLAGLGEQLFASGQRMLDVTGMEDIDRVTSKFFQTQGFDSTGVWNTRQSMLVKLEELLEKYAATPSTVVYLHGVSIRNFEGKIRR